MATRCTVAVIAENGGVGKTKMALTLAVAAVGAGRKVAVFDLDPQATSAQWTDRRKNEFPWVVATPAARRLGAGARGAASVCAGNLAKAGRRAAHKHAGNIGQTAQEFDPRGPAADESQKLYMYTMRQLTNKEQGHAIGKPGHNKA